MRFFHRVALATPESVELDFTLAGIGNRTFALLIDYQIMALVLGLFWLLWTLFSLGLLNYLSQGTVNYTSAPIWLLAIAFLASFVLFTGYFAGFEVLWQGQTPGKRIVKIRVIRDDGRPIGLTQAILRSLLRPIDDLFFIGAFFILLNKHEKRLGDLAAGTLVIQEARSHLQTAPLLSAAAHEFAAELPAISELEQLLPDDFAVVQEYLQRRQQMEPRARDALSLKLARQLRALIALETLPPDTTADCFLEAVYLAYQQQVGEPRR